MPRTSAPIGASKRTTLIGTESTRGVCTERVLIAVLDGIPVRALADTDSDPGQAEFRGPGKDLLALLSSQRQSWRTRIATVDAQTLTQHSLGGRMQAKAPH